MPLIFPVFFNFLKRYNMRIILLAALLLMTKFLCAQKTLIHCGQLIDVKRNEVLKEMTVVVFAKNETTHKQLSQLFEGREVEKYYLGLVLGKIVEQKGTIDVPIMEHPVTKGLMVTNKKGRPSQTDYEVLETLRFFSWLQFQIHTGRTHQIRVHMKHLGHPIVCDELYGDGKSIFLSSLKKKFKLSKDEEVERPILSRLALHSYRLKFELNGNRFDLEAPLPKDLRACLQQLRKASPQPPSNSTSSW